MTGTPVRADGARVGRRRQRAAAVTGLAALLLAAAPSTGAAGAAAPTGDATVRVIVRADDPGSIRAAERAVSRAGGTVGRRLEVISGFSAEVPAGTLPAVRRAAGVRQVTVDAAVRLHNEAWDSDDDDDDENPVEEIGDSAGTERPAAGQLTGAGVGVALIDSGVAPVKGLDQVGKVIKGPDLSFESQATNLRHLDTFGHGTHLAGIIAGRDPDLSGTAPAGSTRFTGIAPGAHLLSLKVATADGATDVSQVLAAIDWVVQHRNDTGFNIRVLNLSFGTDSVQDHRLDPLSYAAEAAWRKGIVVVVAVGNDGAAQTRVAMPAANPYVIAVGAADPNGTESRADDTVADFSARGNETRHADLIAAGRSVVSLRAPGSFVDVHYPQARVESDPQDRFLRGSGTSQAAAVVSGAAALLLQQRPGLTPDQVKRLLTSTAQPLPGADPTAAGAGQLDIARAARTATPQAAQRHPAATGTGSLEQSRGSAHVVDPENGVELSGERDIFGTAWNPARWSATTADARSWSGGTWNGRTWTGGGWSGSGVTRAWSSVTWSGRCFSGLAWSDRTFSDAVFTAGSWSSATTTLARTWSARTWSARTWSARTWSARTWSARTWSARTWSARTWSGMVWNGADWPSSP